MLFLRCLMRFDEILIYAVLFKNGLNLRLTACFSFAVSLFCWFLSTSFLLFPLGKKRGIFLKKLSFGLLLPAVRNAKISLFFEGDHAVLNLCVEGSIVGLPFLFFAKP